MPRPETIEIWRQRIERFDAADITVAKFCQSEGVSQPSFYQWKRTIRQMSQQAESTTAASFRPVRVAAAAINADPPDQQNARPEPPVSPVACTTIELPGGVRIHVEVPTDLVASRLGETYGEETRA